LFHQIGEIPGMINVGVGQHHGLNAGGIKAETPVPLAGFVAFPLKQAAIQEEAFAAQSDQMLRSGYRLDCSMKTDLHQFTSSR
jgi:hypothetical protein